MAAPLSHRRRAGRARGALGDRRAGRSARRLGTRRAPCSRSTARRASIRACAAIEARWIAAVAADSARCAKPCRVVTFARARRHASRVGTGPAPARASSPVLRRPTSSVASTPRSRPHRTAAASSCSATAPQTEGDASRCGRRGTRAQRHDRRRAARRPRRARRGADPPRRAPVVHQGDTVSLLVDGALDRDRAGAALVVRHDGGRAARQRDARCASATTRCTLVVHRRRAAAGTRSGCRCSCPATQRPQNDALVGERRCRRRPARRGGRRRPPTRAIAAILAARGDPDRRSARPAALPVSAAAATRRSTRSCSTTSRRPRSSTTQIAALTRRRARRRARTAHARRPPRVLARRLRAQRARQACCRSRASCRATCSARNLAIELVLDRSGSMTDTVGGVPQDHDGPERRAPDGATFVARARGRARHRRLRHRARTCCSPMQRVDAGRARSARVDARSTACRPTAAPTSTSGLQAGLHADPREQLAEPPHHPADRRHQPAAQLHRAARALAQHHITVATVALGTDVDCDAAARHRDGHRRQLLRRRRNARELPRIFVKETRLSAKPVQVTRPPAGAAAGEQPGRALARRHDAAAADRQRRDARSGRRAGRSDRRAAAARRPIPRSRSGASAPGRVVSWTPGLGAALGAAWTAAGALWNDAVRWRRARRAAPRRARRRHGAATTSSQVDLARCRPDAGDGDPRRARATGAAPAGRAAARRRRASTPAARRAARPAATG